MDPGAMMNDGSFGNGGGNTMSFSLAEIWPFLQAVNAAGGGALGLKRLQFGLGQFGDFIAGPNREPGPVALDQNQRRKRCESEKESPKGVSTSNVALNAMNDGDGKRLKGGGGGGGASGSRNESRDAKV